MIWTCRDVAPKSTYLVVRVEVDHASPSHFICSRLIERVRLANQGPTKSILTPIQRMTFLGFVIGSVQMSLKITREKEKDS